VGPDWIATGPDCYWANSWRKDEYGSKAISYEKLLCCKSKL